jgi:hypothetical protein
MLTTIVCGSSRAPNIVAANPLHACSPPPCLPSANGSVAPKVLADSQHVRIPPAAHTYQSDVETVHRIEEDEFFDLEDFASWGDFLAKTHTYQLYFNLERPNAHKENLSPWQIIERLAPRSPLELCLLPPVFLDYYPNDSGGYDVPRLP